MYTTIIERRYNLGREVTDKIDVAYDYISFGSETTYSPISGACGGDPVEIEIKEAWLRDGRRVTLLTHEYETVEEFACEHVHEAMGDLDAEMFELDMNERNL